MMLINMATHQQELLEPYLKCVPTYSTLNFLNVSHKKLSLCFYFCALMSFNVVFYLKNRERIESKFGQNVPYIDCLDMGYSIKMDVGGQEGWLWNPITTNIPPRFGDHHQ